MHYFYIFYLVLLCNFNVLLSVGNGSVHTGQRKPADSVSSNASALTMNTVKPLEIEDTNKWLYKEVVDGSRAYFCAELFCLINYGVYLDKQRKGADFGAQLRSPSNQGPLLVLLLFKGVEERAEDLAKNFINNAFGSDRSNRPVYALFTLKIFKDSVSQFASNDWNNVKEWHAYCRGSFMVLLGREVAKSGLPEAEREKYIYDFWNNVNGCVRNGISEDEIFSSMLNMIAARWERMPASTLKTTSSLPSPDTQKSPDRTEDAPKFQGVVYPMDKFLAQAFVFCKNMDVSYKRDVINAMSKGDKKLGKLPLVSKNLVDEIREEMFDCRCFINSRFIYVGDNDNVVAGCTFDHEQKKIVCVVGVNQIDASWDNDLRKLKELFDADHKIVTWHSEVELNNLRFLRY